MIPRQASHTYEFADERNGLSSGPDVGHGVNVGVEGVVVS